MGCQMKSYKSFVFLSLLACLVLDSCSGLPKGNGGGGGSTANLSFVMVADTPPSTLGLISFKVVPTSIVLTPSTGTATTFDLNGQTGFSFDLVRLQSDSAFLGTATKVPTGTYSSIAVSFFSAELTFFNGTGVALTNPVCAAGAVCTASFTGPFTSTITTSQTISGDTGFGIDINLANAITITGTTLTLNLANSSGTTVASDFTLPRANSNLASGQLDIIEDFTGIATTSGSTVTIKPATVVNRAPITASTASSTNYDPDPTGTLCSTGTTQLTSCVSNNQAASMDAILNSDGTFTVQEIEPLLASPVVDTVEGTVDSIATNSATQFGIVVTDIIPAASGSLISSLSIGAPLTVNLATAPIFHVDTKGLSVANSFPASYGNFANATTTAALQLGQSVAIHVKAFTIANGTTAAISDNVDTVTLRWSRFTATPTGALSASLLNINTLPVYFGFGPSSVFGVEIFTGTPGAHGVTNLDGILNGSAPAASPAVGIRALYINNAANTFSNQAFFAAKVRQH
jgi:hypothetical protein